MINQNTDHLPRWLVYLIPLVLGIAFSLTIFFIVWNKSLSSSEQNFLLETISFKERITRNSLALENIASNISSLLQYSPSAQQDLVDDFAKNVYSTYPFIDGFRLYKVNMDTPPDNPNQAFIDEQYLQVLLGSDKQQQNAIDVKTLIKPLDFLTAVNTIGAGEQYAITTHKAANPTHFFLFSKIVMGVDSPDNNNNLALVLFVNSSRFFSDQLVDSEVNIKVFSESRDILGRQLLFQNENTIPYINDWLITEIDDQESVQLSSFSIKFDFSKKLYWREIDQALILASIITGLGITLLLIALVRSKELQSRELTQRNIVIQNKVDEQTRELALARDKAVDASRIKSEFLASMSHEIRTPLNAIIGISELMAETPLNQEQTKYIKIFRKAGDALLSLVNDILDLSKIEAQQLILEEIPFNLIDLIEESIDIYALKAAEKNINLVGRVEPGTKNNRVGDPVRLRQVVLNLISNALKFTDKGEIFVSVRESDDPDQKDHLVFSVRDTGIGIPDDKLEAIFASFTQVDSSTTRKYGGTGLGLTISKSLVHMMNGEIWVDSAVDEGSTFAFTAELGHAEEVPAITGSFPIINLKDQRVLIVDDNSTNRLILRDTLEMMQAECVEADSGLMALINLQQDDNFTLYLIDYEMPEMNGIQLAEQFAEMGIDLSKVMMISSAIYGDEINDIKKLNLGAYLYKPVKRAELLQQIATVIYGKDAPEESIENNQVTAMHEDRSYRILLVEDNEDNRLLVKMFLKDKNYVIDDAENGQIAVDKFINQDYDLVLMDVQMPVMDGHQATRKIRAWEQAQSLDATPVIALTAHAIREEIDKCLEAGCDTHLGKPIKKLTLQATLEQYLESKTVSPSDNA